ncbi:hypothetical protein SNK04_014494 [Fusarium graminearum]
MPTPWADVNKAIGGLQDGQVIVLAARSNMGKSLLDSSRPGSPACVAMRWRCSPWR